MEDILSRVCYAFGDEQRYRVWPIYAGEALVKITPINQDDEEIGDSFRVLRGDFLEEYNLYDINGVLLQEALGEDEDDDDDGEPPTKEEPAPEEEPEEEPHPEECDYAVTIEGDHYIVSEVGGHFARRVNTSQEVYNLIKVRMDKEHFWPNVWECSDHGNISRVGLDYYKEG